MILGLDFGEKTIGVAASLNGVTATGVTTLRRESPEAIRKNLKELKALAAEYHARQIVIGLPLHTGGGDTGRAEATRLFAGKLSRYVKREAVLWDERYSTAAVLRHAPRERTKVDEMAAVYILQGYLDYKNKKEKFIMQNEAVNPEVLDDDGESDIVLVADDGTEIPLDILASRETEGTMYVLAADENGEVVHMKCTPEGDDDVLFDIIDEGHEEYEAVFAMFREDYENLGIEIEDDVEDIDE